MVQRDQATSYYCGPSTTESILGYLVSSAKSKYDGVSLTQAHLAGSSYLQTDSSGGTPWADGRMRVALNRWAQGYSDGFYVNTAAPSAANYRSYMIYDIDYYHPFANSTVEFAGSSYHYNHHPVSRTIGHWVPTRGYTSSGATAQFADPAHSSHVSWGSLPAEYFTYSSSSWASHYVNSHGIVW